MELEYLYRVNFKGDSLFESTEKREVEFFVDLIQEKKEDIFVERAELNWEHVPVEDFDREDADGG